MFFIRNFCFWFCRFTFKELRKERYTTGNKFTPGMVMHRNAFIISITLVIYTDMQILLSFNTFPNVDPGRDENTPEQTP